MRCFLWSLLVTVLPAGTDPRFAAEEPRVLVERALKARGGGEAISKLIGFRLKTKEHFYSGLAPRPGTILMASLLLELSERSTMNYEPRESGERIRVTVILDGIHSWSRVNGRLVPFGKREIEWACAARYRGRVVRLMSLLTDKGFTLAPLEKIKVDDRPAQGINVSYKDQPDTQLYFDKETGYLVKYSYRGKKFDTGKETLHETFLNDYVEPNLAAPDERILREAKMEATDAALLAFFRANPLSKAASDCARALICQLGDDQFRVREKASRDLVALGARALPLLREAVKNTDLELARRARDCWVRIGARPSEPHVLAAIRLLGLRKPAGAAEALLDYVPFASADAAEEVRAALVAIAQKDGKTEFALHKALKDDKEPARRQVVEAVLGKDGGAYLRRAGRRLFSPQCKVARKHTIRIDGKLYLEMEISDFQFFNDMDDKEFARP